MIEHFLNERQRDNDVKHDERSLFNLWPKPTVSYSKALISDGVACDLHRRPQTCPGHGPVFNQY